MIVFLSWSQARARRVAETLSRWLPDVVAGARPWMSDRDLRPGERIGAEVSSAMDGADCGVLVLTRDNTSPAASWWLPFEAGYLRASARSGSALRVIPLLVDGLPAGDVPDALRQFAALDLDRAGVLQLVLRLNGALPTPQDEATVRVAFDRHWPRLERALDLAPDGWAPQPQPQPQPRPRLERQEAATVVEDIHDLLTADGHLRPFIHVLRTERSIDVALSRHAGGELTSALRRLVERHRVTVELSWPSDDGTGAVHRTAFRPVPTG
jgi:hypothetical protein